jgi:alcohol dehydrogenase class IV
MLKSFVIDQPQTIHFGIGSRERIPELLGRFGRKVLLFSGRSWFKDSGWQATFERLLTDFEVRYLQCPGGEPETGAVSGLLEEARGFAPDVLLAVGGGSVLDTAKAVSGLAPLADPVEDFLEGVGRGLRVPRPGIPWIAVPTTAGTGAEVTKNAVLKAPAVEAKKSLRSPFILASAVVVDPELSRHCPLQLTGIAGMDALTQLIESFVSKKSAPLPRAWVRDAFPVMLAALLRLPQDSENLEARSGAAYGALASGFALANGGLGAAHGFASGLGGVYDIPHGLLCALFIRPVLKANAQVIEKDLALLRRAVGERKELFEPLGGIPGGAGHDFSGEAPQGDAGEGSVTWLLETIDPLFDWYGLPTDLRDYAVDPARVPELARRSSGSSMSGNPRDLDQDEREGIIRGLLPGGSPP